MVSVAEKLFETIIFGLYHGFDGGELWLFKYRFWESKYIAKRWAFLLIPPYFIFDHHNMPAIFWGFELPFDLFGLLNLHLAIFNKINTLHYFSIRQWDIK